MGSVKKAYAESAPLQRRPGSRVHILNAAVEEFAREGVAGARTSAIASAAGVNIALLYYYFDTKEKLYGAVLEQTFSAWASALRPILDRKGCPKDKLLSYVGAYFDFVAESPWRPRLVQQEMMRQGRSGSPHVKRLAKKYFLPIHKKLLALLDQGYAAGHFRRAEAQFLYSLSGIISSYFISAPFIEIVDGCSPLTPSRIAERRRAVLDQVAAMVFRPPKPESRPAASKGRCQ